MAAAHVRRRIAGEASAQEAEEWAQVIAELHLEDQLNPRSFVDSALSADEVRGTQMVRVTVTLPNPELAADASRRLTSKAILLAQQIDRQKVPG